MAKKTLGRVIAQRTQDHQDSLLDYSAEDSKRLIDSVKEGDIIKFKACLASGTPIDARFGGGGFTSLHVAVLDNKTEILKLICDQKPNFEKVAGYKFTALIMAIMDNNFQMVQFLLDSGADANGDDGESFSALRYAVDRNNKEIVSLLIERGAQFEGHPKEEEDLLFSLCDGTEHGFEMIELLISKGANVNKVNNKNMTPLSRAILFNKIEIVEILLKNGANVNVEKNLRGPLILFALTKGAEPIFNLLLETGKVRFDLKDKKGLTLIEALKFKYNNKDISKETYERIIPRLRAQREKQRNEIRDVFNIKKKSILSKYKSKDLVKRPFKKKRV